MEQSNGRELGLLLASGKVLPFTRRELRHVFGSRVIHIIFCLSGAFWLGLLALWSENTDPATLLFTILVVLPLTVILTYVAYFGSIEVVIAFAGDRQVLMPEPFLSLFVALLVIPFQSGLALMSGYEPFGGTGMSVEDILFHFGALQVTVLGYAHFLRPIMNAKMAVPEEQPASAAMAQEAQPKQLRIGDVVTVIDTLELVEARDHYVAIVSRAGEAEFRGRLKDAVSQLKDVPGRLIHRSLWVHDAAVVGASRKKNGLWLVLRSGREVKVARPRQPETEEWLRTRGML